ncbi:MAG: bifunctional 5,10-methylene-tetrahydrofolate dehydrogenase/5,10-methylene-tetrahydrofolate cyclohydrolase, partial [Bacteroidales bacterium]|nr:bifunctional 5,10-methylene-tetrahydrofolate dehydrogenase/5,10-methylene-tetrahydrofolate cyclohydrolase [Bacteroidales bacterium]
MSQIIDGKAVSLEIKEDLKAKVEAIKAAGERVPCLAVVVAGDNPAS